MQWHDIAILSCTPAPATGAAPSTPLQPQALVDEVQILQAHSAIGHRLAPQRLRRRLELGLTFLRFDHAGLPVASTWLAGERGRYIDELNWLVPLGVGEWWVRDVFVTPAMRGRRLFSDMMQALGRWGPPVRCLWSDVDWDNRASMNAHLAAGFQVVARARALDLRGRVRWRSALPPLPMAVREIAPASRWLWLRGATVQRHRELIA